MVAHSLRLASKQAKETKDWHSGRHVVYAISFNSQIILQSVIKYTLKRTNMVRLRKFKHMLGSDRDWFLTVYLSKSHIHNPIDIHLY